MSFCYFQTCLCSFRKKGSTSEIEWELPALHRISHHREALKRTSLDVVNIMAIALFIVVIIVVIIVTILVIIIITIISMSLAQIERVLDTCVTVRYSVSPTRRRGWCTSREVQPVSTLNATRNPTHFTLFTALDMKLNIASLHYTIITLGCSPQCIQPAYPVLTNDAKEMTVTCSL